jgi:hypothetical protein
VTPTITLTNSPSNTPTITPTTPAVVCVCYTLFWSQPPSGPFVGSTTFNYIDCEGSPASSFANNLGDSPNICAQQDTISFGGGDNTGGWSPSIYNCCVTPISLGYRVTNSVCSLPGWALVEQCINRSATGLCDATELYSSDIDGNCTFSFASAGYYKTTDNVDRRYWDGTTFTGTCFGCGCLVVDTVITLSDGSTKLIQDIQIDDILKSLDVSGMPQPSNEWYSWSSDTLNYVESTSTVNDVAIYVFDSVVNINEGRLIATDTHNHVVKQNDVWYIRTTSELNVGDILLDMDNSEFEITSLVTITEPTTVYNIDVTNSNLYFANNVLTHNK